MFFRGSSGRALVADVSFVPLRAIVKPFRLLAGLKACLGHLTEKLRLDSCFYKCVEKSNPKNLMPLKVIKINIITP